MPPLPEGRPLAADPARTNDYDSFAEAYTAENEAGIQNAYYERPAMLRFAGEVARPGDPRRRRRLGSAGRGAARARRACQASTPAPGCWSWPRQRLGADADLRVIDLSGPLPFPDGAFDVIAALVLHYLQDWGPRLTELRRVLVPGGRLLSRSTIRSRSTPSSAWRREPQRLHRGRPAHLRHRRTAARADRPRAVPRGVPRAHDEPELPVLRPSAG